MGKFETEDERWAYIQEQAYRHTWGEPRHPLYNAWINLKQRCQGKHVGSQDYPERGIDYDPRWKSFATFLGEMGPTWREGLTLDRKDNNKGYSKDNCWWVTRQDQAVNKRNSLTEGQLTEARRMLARGLWSYSEIARVVGTKKHVIADLNRKSRRPTYG